MIAIEKRVESAVPVATPPYWAEARKQLMKKDRVMKRLIPQLGDAALQSRGDAFTTLARSIVGQQISVKAAQTVWDRFAALPTAMAPAQVLALKVEEMRAAGLSARKADYLLDLARHFDAGQLHTADWHGMDDEAIISELLAIRGVGRWTAEMFLIFHLQRPDVLPLDDIGLQRAISLHYLDKQSVDKKTMIKLAQPWQPWRSVATWYLWRSLDPLPVEY